MSTQPDTAEMLALMLSELRKISDELCGLRADLAAVKITGPEGATVSLAVTLAPGRLGERVREGAGETCSA